MPTTVKVKIAKDGSDVKIEVEGFAGSGCESLTRDLETAIGTVQKSERTADYYQENPLTLNAKVGG